LEKAVSLDDLKNQHDSKVSANITDEKKLESVLSLAGKCNYEKQHTHQVEKLVLQLFDQLTKLHRLGGRERFLLRCGTLLHDIGWVEGQKGHHKVALKIIMDDKTLPFNFRDKSIIALLARYHRKRLPDDWDTYYRDLSDKDRTIVRKLAGILRIADGLDRTHCNLVETINCAIKGDRLLLACSSKKPLNWEISAAGKKADLFNKVFGKKVFFRRKPG
jgi:exopolyphosphatase/guanosine-5'-triphosphate,3'-diphosphate pyrophosphatase